MLSKTNGSRGPHKESVEKIAKKHVFPLLLLPLLVCLQLANGLGPGGLDSWDFSSERDSYERCVFPNEKQIPKSTGPQNQRAFTTRRSNLTVDPKIRKVNDSRRR